MEAKQASSRKDVFFLLESLGLKLWRGLAILYFTKKYSVSLAIFFAGAIFQLPILAQNTCCDGFVSKSATPNIESTNTVISAEAVAPNKIIKASMSPDFPIAGKVSSSLQKISGLDFLGEWVASFVASKLAQRRFGGHVKLKLRIYSFTDLLAGKFKKINLEARGCRLRNMPLGAVTISSTSPVWFDWRKRDGKTPGLANPIALSVTGKLSQEEISSLLQSQSVTSSLRGLKLDLPGLGDQQLQVLNPKVALVNGAIVVDALMITKGASADTGVCIQISGLPTLVGSKLILKDMQVSSSDILDSSSFATFLQDLFNPIFDFGKLDRTTRALRLSSLVVERGSVCCDGTLILAPKKCLVSTPRASIDALSK